MALISDQEAFELAIDQSPQNFLLRLIYADWLEDRGEMQLAYAQRWMGKNEKCPGSSKVLGFTLPHHKHYWAWWRQGSPNNYSKDIEHLVPLYLFYSMKHPGPKKARYKTRQKAEQALAVSLNLHLHCPCHEKWLQGVAGPLIEWFHREWEQEQNEAKAL